MEPEEEIEAEVEDEEEEALSIEFNPVYSIFKSTSDGCNDRMSSLITFWFNSAATVAPFSPTNSAFPSPSGQTLDQVSLHVCSDIERKDFYSRIRQNFRAKPTCATLLTWPSVTTNTCRG